MTYSVIARCERTGRFGIGVASHSLAIGAYCDGALRPNVGVTFTQGRPLPRNNRLAMNLLAQGCTPAQTLAALEANDPHHAHRQIALVDREGAALAHTGSRVGTPAAHRMGSGYVACGTTVAGTLVRYTGDRMPDPAKDSVLVLAGGPPRVLALSSVSPGSCPSLQPGETGLVLRAAGPLDQLLGVEVFGG